MSTHYQSGDRRVPFPFLGIGRNGDRPTIGVAKSLLLGKHATLGEEKGSYTPLIAKNETIGVVFRSRTRVKPLYLSIGHRVDLATAIDYVCRCLTKYRLPEPTRIADKLSKQR
jgi:deoxyribonuclease V